MTHDAERCQRCHQPIRPGATFCSACGAPLINRAAHNVRNIDHSQRELMEKAAAHGGPIPGSIPVAQARPETIRTGGHVQGGGTGMAGTLDLVPAAAGKRLGAAVLDWLAPLTVLVVMFSLGFASITRTQSGGFITYDTGMLVLLGGIALGITVAYILVLLSIEGRSGNTIGNRLMGIRSTDQDGYAPGAGALFLRGAITGAGVLLATVTTAFVVIFKWFDTALWILTPLTLIGAAWAFAVVVSNSWDKNGKLRGWHDAAAKTLVFDVSAGRNPVATGGIQGPYTFAPLDLPPVQQVSSPIAGAAGRVPQASPPQAIKPHVINAQVINAQGALSQGVTQPAPIPQPPLNPNQWQPPAITQPWADPASSAKPAFTPAEPPAHAATAAAPASATFQGRAVHPDDDHERTQMRGGPLLPAPVAVLRIRLDDGRDFQLDRTVLIGRNPTGHPGERIAQLLAVPDPGRSISKTHLHLLADNGGIWVTDRNSTNGSAVTTPDGARTALQAGEPVYVRPGSTVHFGDRTFHLGQA